MIALALLLSLPATSPVSDPDAAFAEHLAVLAGTRPTQWRVVWSHEPATAATVSWSTAEPGRTHRVLFGPGDPGDPESADRYPSTQDSHRDGPYSRRDKDRATPAHYHHARLTGLAPSTTYRFVIESDGERSPELSFRTAPDDERPVAILAGGDSRSGWRARCFVNTAIASLIEADESILALSHGGDYVFDGSRWDQWSRWLSHHELVRTSTGRVLPIVPTRGNHDVGPLFAEIFDDPGTPAGDGRGYYRTKLSADVSLLTLNSEVPVTGDQLDWLESELAAANEDSRWIFASYHRALYPAVKGPAPAHAFWPPLFDRFGVDLVLESDGHAIKRTVPIRDGAAHPLGVVYVGEGGLGVPQRNPRTDAWYLQPPGLATQGHHVLRLDFGPDAMRVRFLRLPELPATFAAEDFREVIGHGARWSYLASDDAPDDWMQPGFDASGWPLGEAGFGFGDDDDVTVLDDMRTNHARVYVRRDFDAATLEGSESLNLMCRYDDAFVAYLNGVEVARGSIDPPSKPGGRARVHAHEARAFEVFPLDGWRAQLRPGRNVLAIVGHNKMRSDRDFTLDPWLAGDRLHDPAREGLELEVIDDTTLEPRER